MNFLFLLSTGFHRILLFLEILFKDPEKLGSMPFIKGDLRKYSTCKGEQLYCAKKIFNKMSNYDTVSSFAPNISNLNK